VFLASFRLHTVYERKLLAHAVRGFSRLSITTFLTPQSSPLRARRASACELGGWRPDPPAFVLLQRNVSAMGCRRADSD
jgi:hypothetical protein